MTLDQFTTFAAVAKHRNITRASKELRISQPAVTKHLRLLEQACNSKLYIKSSKGIELTIAGEILLRHVHRILNASKKLYDTFNVGVPGKGTRSLTVAGNFAASSSFLPELLSIFQRTHAQLRLSLRTDNRIALERMLLNFEADVAVMNYPPQSLKLATEPYRKEIQVAFVSPNHPLSKKQSFTAKELLRAPLILRQIKGADSQFEKALKQIAPDAKPNVILRCETPDAAKTAVRKLLGVGILFESNVKSEIRAGIFKKLKLSGFKLEGQSYIVFHKDRPRTAAVQEFLTLLRRHRDKNLW